jgi:hypothetical protein
LRRRATSQSRGAVGFIIDPYPAFIGGIRAQHSNAGKIQYRLYML